MGGDVKCIAVKEEKNLSVNGVEVTRQGWGRRCEGTATVCRLGWCVCGVLNRACVGQWLTYIIIVVGLRLSL